MKILVVIDIIAIRIILFKNRLIPFRMNKDVYSDVDLEIITNNPELFIQEMFFVNEFGED